MIPLLPFKSSKLLRETEPGELIIIPYRRVGIPAIVTAIPADEGKLVILLPQDAGELPNYMLLEHPDEDCLSFGTDWMLDLQAEHLYPGNGAGAHYHGFVERDRTGRNTLTVQRNQAHGLSASQHLRVDLETWKSASAFPATGTVTFTRWAVLLPPHFERDQPIKLVEYDLAEPTYQAAR